MTHRHVPRGTEPKRGLVMLAGPSNSGKTYSALLVADGIRAVVGGRVALLDTELRGNLYEEEFEYERFVMDPDFTPRAFIEAYQELDKKFSVIITDNFSDEYEGVGGISEMAAKQSGGNEVAKWAKPKAEHKGLMSRIRLLKSQHIFCLRASDKIMIEEGEDEQGNRRRIVRPLGWMPIAEKNFVYDVTLGFMLPPASEGKARVVKNFRAFKGVFRDGVQLCRDHGAAIGRWTMGEEAGSVEPPAEGPATARAMYEVRDDKGELQHATTDLHDALRRYGEVKLQRSDKMRVAVHNLDLLRAAAAKAKNGLRKKLEDEIAAADLLSRPPEAPEEVAADDLLDETALQPGLV